MKRRLLAWLLVLCLAVSLLPTAFATETETYATWPTASDGKINLTSGTYRLSDCENKRIDRATVVIPSGATVTLDLAGGTIDNPVDHAIENSGTLNIVGTGGIVVSHAENCAAIVNYPGATATITSGTYQSEKWYTIKNFGVMTFDGNSQIDVATYNGNSSSLIANGWANGSVKSNNDLNVSHTPETADATLTIKNANFHAYGCNDTTAIVKNDDYGVLDIQNGIFDTSNSKTTDATIILNWNKATISGGTFTGNYPISTGSNVNQDNGNACDTKISGGTFTGQTCLFGQSGTGSGGTVTITDGIFDGDFRNGESTNVSTKFIIKGGTFTDIASAMTYADSSSNVYLKLREDVTTGVTVPKDTNITLDLNNHNISVNGNHAIKNQGTLCIKGAGTIETSGGNYAAIMNDAGATATVYGGTYVSDSWYVLVNNGTMEINGPVSVEKPVGSTNTASLIRNVGSSEDAEANLTIKNGSFIGVAGQNSCSVVKNDDFGVLTIEGGTFDSTANEGSVNATTILNWHKATISGGTFIGSYPISNGVYHETSNNQDYYTAGEVTISGGTFIGLSSLIGRGTGAEAGKGQMTITGGTFNAPVLYNAEEKGDLPYDLVISGGKFTNAKPDDADLDTGYGLNGDTVQKKVTVTAAAVSNGSIALSSSAAFAGDTITVTATPNDHYELDTITATTNDGTPLTVTNSEFTIPVNFDGTITVTATFKPETYTVSFCPNNGDAAIEKSVAHGDKITDKPADPTKDGYTFAGWYTTDGSKWDFDRDTVTDTLFLMAKWDVKVELDSNTVIDVEVNETTTGTVGDQVKAEDKDAAKDVADSASVTKVTDAVAPDDVADIVSEAVEKANEGNSKQTKLDADSDVQVNISVAVEVTQYDASNKTLTFTAEPVATVAVNGTTLKDKNGKDVQVPVTNDMLSQGVMVQITLPAGFSPEQIKHIAKDGTVEYFWKYDESYDDTVKTFTITPDNVAVFCIEHFSTFELINEDAVEYTINWTYEAYGKTVTYATTYVASGKEIVAPAGTPTRIGSNFAGWEGFESGKTATANMTFTANWKAQTYSDLTEPRFCSKAVEWATKNAITNGMDNNCFEPDLECTRSQIVTFLWRAAGCPEPTTTTTTFTDLDNTRFYYKAVLWATEQGIVKGYKDNTFRPDEPCERCEAMCFLYRFAVPDATDGNSSGENGTFIDLNENWYMNAVNWATKTGVTKGMDATHFGPEETCTRGHFLTFLWRAVTGSELKDGNSVMETNWANWMGK